MNLLNLFITVGLFFVTLTSYAEPVSPVAACYDLVKNKTGSLVTYQQAIELCRGTTDIQPALCFNQVKYEIGSTISNDQAVELCKPIRCEN